MSIHAVTEARRKEAHESGASHATTYVGTSPIKCNKLGHFVYEVSDIERTLRFWTEVMGFKESDRNEHGMIFLRCAADHHGIGLKPIGKGKEPRRDMKNTLQVEHLAFEVDNIEVLKQAKVYFKQNNIPVTFEGRKGGGCNISINFLDPDGYEFEIYCEMDQIGSDDRVRPASQFKRRNPLEDAIADPVQKTW